MRRSSGVLVAGLLMLTACNSNAKPVADACARAAVSAAACGGMNGLVAAARSEGSLNLIALPRAWVNYGAILDAFSAKYGIKVSMSNPNGMSEDEIAAVRAMGAASNAPDALDLRVEVAAANAQLLAPYYVASWDSIPQAQKDANGSWSEDYGGYMSIGYDPSKVPAIASVDDLLGPQFRGKVALAGSPATNASALGAVMMVGLAEGGSLDDISTGVAWFHRLRAAGNLLATAANSITIKKGATPVVLDWDYLSVAHVAGVPGWTVYVPDTAVIGGYYAQAINKNAPHPAAARLWEEYLYSDEGQNLWLKGPARPVRMPVMQSTGTIDRAAAGLLPITLGTPVFASVSQASMARTYLTSHWPASGP